MMASSLRLMPSVLSHNSWTGQASGIRWLVVTWRTCGFVEGNLRMPTCAWPEHQALCQAQFLYSTLQLFWIIFLAFWSISLCHLPRLASFKSVWWRYDIWPLASHLKSESSSWNVRRHLVAMVTCLYQLLFVLVWEDGMFCVFLCCECLWAGIRVSLGQFLSVLFVCVQ